MRKYIMRLDDACEKRNKQKWDRCEELLDYYDIKPLVGVIPNIKIEKTDKNYDMDFWEKVKKWQNKGWVIALHGDTHELLKCNGGFFSVNSFSEFVGLPLSIQKQKIRNGINCFKKYEIVPKVFFAPAHTFDDNTLIALREESEIRIISDTIANEPYCCQGFTFVPQQSGKVRNLPLSMVTFCYHPNTMKEDDFIELDKFLKKNKKRFIDFPCTIVQRKFSFFDSILKFLYFLRK